MWEAVERGEIVLGGCIVDDGAASLACLACGHRWGAPPDRIDGIAAFVPGRRG
jgi:hypothetical protein